MAGAYKPRILIVDDEVNFRESLLLGLEDSFDVVVAGSLGQARGVISEKTPDAVLLDVRLPDGNGMELMPDLRSLAPAPLVIIMTAYVTKDLVQRAYREGAASYLVKPFELTGLKCFCKEQLERRRGAKSTEYSH